ncbi:hypothetical protein AAW12_23960 [Sphingobacterium sp. Ag1]|uniref:tetratricopeptide repeat protein n=1 Tax=Sphingobacterium sp. Ag1 TaxID=1643451 RepID=UPI000627D4A6|nr:hypothetical protein [Sphingobacterium sp. Ag1]KKO89182.1 hypothetical protein AAW12_23960 [Sphingobacterium sp. Ag1]
MERNEREVSHMKQLAAQYLRRGEIENALITYHKILDHYPQEKSYYTDFIKMLLDPITISEIGFSAYEQAISCCEDAIKYLVEDDIELFYMKKGSIYLMMLQKDPSWDRKNRSSVLDFVEDGLKKFPNNQILLNCATALYRLSGIIHKYGECLDQLLQIHPKDIFLILERVSVLEQMGRQMTAIPILENWINENPKGDLSTAYVKIISLYKAVDNHKMSAYYQLRLEHV